MRAIFHPDQDEKFQYKCPMCNTVFESKNPECPTCETTAIRQVNQLKTKQVSENTGSPIAPLVFITLLVLTGLVIYDSGIFQNIDSITNNDNQPFQPTVRDATKIHDDLRIGNSLFSYYETIRDEYGSDIRTIKEHCQFSAQLALHDLHRLYWKGIEEKYGEDVGGESYLQAYEILLKAYEYREIDDDDSDVDKIEKILDFVTWFIVYEPEIDDSKRAPVETLSLRSGDCDDFSILTSALFELGEIDCAIGFFENDSSAHVMVLVHLEDLGSYECWYNDDLTHYNLQDGKWITIEPQTTIEYQADEEWMQQWNIEMAVEIDYEKATS